MLSKSSISVIASLATIFVLTSCTKETVIEKQIEKKQAPQNMLQSFTPTTADECAKANCVKIQKDSLGKIFLLIASGKTSGATPQWYDLKPLVVSFERSGNRIAILGENYNSIYSEIKAVNLIQTFEVVTEDQTSITFDWGQGLKTFVMQGSYDVDAARGKNNDLTESSFTSLIVEDSFVRNIKYDAKNIELEQIAKISSANLKGADKTWEVQNREETLAMNIQIRAYNLSANFQKKEYDKSRRVGFFVTKVTKPGYSTDLVNLITKWDISPEKGPITVRISSSVPAEYLDAVKEAALYWNFVFGRDVVTVRAGVDPSSGPEDRSIMIRWIPWLDAGAAYAMGQSDPLTGEILRAQVFMPSVFTRVPSTDLVTLNDNSPVAGGIACDLGPTLEALAEISKEASDSQRLRLARDSVRATVAHELGHALGLRHNFAGSFSAKVSAQEVSNSARKYVQDPAHLGLETSTSIMDYTSGVDNVLLAARLKHSGLAYDKMAMAWAYSADDSALDEKVSKYCTDDDISLASKEGMQVYGCERFDSGNNPLLREVLDQSLEKTNFIKILFASMIGRMYPADDATKVNDLGAVIQDTMKFSHLNTEPIKFAGKFLLDPSKNSVAAGKFASIELVKSGQIQAARFGLDTPLQVERTRALKQAGGVAGIFNLLLRSPDGSLDIHWIEKAVADIKAQPYFKKGKTLAGREYDLSLAQQDQLAHFFSSLIPVNNKAVLNAMKALLPQVNQKVPNQTGGADIINAVFARYLITEADANALAQLYLDIMVAQSGVETIKIGEEQKDMEVPKAFVYSDERIVWANLLSSKGLTFDMELRKAQIRKVQFDKINAFIKLVDPQLDLSAVQKPENLAEELMNKDLLNYKGSKWLKEEISVLTALDKLL